MQAERDWSRPVWYDPSLVERYDAAEKAMLDAAVQQVCDEQERQAGLEAEAAARWFARNGIFGLSSSEEMEVVRDTGIDAEWPLQAFDRINAIILADFWHEMPDGVDSIRTVRNYLHGGRKFFRFCETQEEYGWTTPRNILTEYTASKVDTPAMPYVPGQIRRILAAGGSRLKMYCAFGLTCGFYQKDCTRIFDAEYYLEAINHYIKRLRCKESRPRQGRLPIAVRHWIAPELVALIEAVRGRNPEGVLFNSERGTALTIPAIAGVWRRACEDSGEHLPFKQLRKIGFNSIKRVSKSLEVADLWAGHSLGTTDAYDDGIFEPVNEAERLWCEEQRRDGIL